MAAQCPDPQDTFALAPLFTLAERSEVFMGAVTLAEARCSWGVFTLAVAGRQRCTRSDAIVCSIEAKVGGGGPLIQRIEGGADGLCHFWMIRVLIRGHLLAVASCLSTMGCH